MRETRTADSAGCWSPTPGARRKSWRPPKSLSFSTTCLRDYLASGPSLPEGAIAYVADHRTKEWVAAAKAAYTRNPAVETPMSSHLLAHADGASRDLDPESRGGTSLSPTDVFGPSGPPDGGPEK